MASYLKIPPADVVNAYTKTGLQVKLGGYFSAPDQMRYEKDHGKGAKPALAECAGCAMTALALDLGAKMTCGGFFVMPNEIHAAILVKYFGMERAEAVRPWGSEQGKVNDQYLKGFANGYDYHPCNIEFYMAHDRLTAAEAQAYVMGYANGQAARCAVRQSLSLPEGAQ